MVNHYVLVVKGLNVFSLMSNYSCNGVGGKIYDPMYKEISFYLLSLTEHGYCVHAHDLFIGRKDEWPSDAWHAH